ncbi:Uncharacterized protein conserved in bacteria [Mycobacteroides abscessus subsp. abscessus]|nr:Uncharacterized protein conserved in bacteria [Mycobacteroides abscessus subsp. abscessus]
MIGSARHSETLETLTLYEHLWPHEQGLWVRPQAMFEGRLDDGRVRFELLRRD